MPPTILNNNQGLWIRVASFRLSYAASTSPFSSLSRVNWHGSWYWRPWVTSCGSGASSNGSSSSCVCVEAGQRAGRGGVLACCRCLSELQEEFSTKSPYSPPQRVRAATVHLRSPMPRRGHDPAFARSAFPPRRAYLVQPIRSCAPIRPALRGDLVQVGPGRRQQQGEYHCQRLLIPSLAQRI